ncbi:hypothetical protein [uncultured Tenacibaculum sp.]|uniref:hypothetical protein n=1 Tax=uncultured Tenacibaculum sp. TaxID=174713 RepID=UPI002638AD1E|nr:hypothetical protein [uncultured Tenacibaculum sp.]
MKNRKIHFIKLILLFFGVIVVFQNCQNDEENIPQFPHENTLKLNLKTVSFQDAQTKNDDAYYILNENHKEYVLRTNRTGRFNLYNRVEYEKREQQVLKDKKEGKFHNYQFYKRPQELIFNKVYGSKVEAINHCDTHFLNLVNYKWIQDNTWKENNSNVLFKDLYFLFRVEKDKYLKFKVVRTAIAR